MEVQRYGNFSTLEITSNGVQDSEVLDSESLPLFATQYDQNKSVEL